MLSSSYAGLVEPSRIDGIRWIDDLADAGAQANSLTITTGRKPDDGLHSSLCQTRSILGGSSDHDLCDNGQSTRDHKSSRTFKCNTVIQRLCSPTGKAYCKIAQPDAYLTKAFHLIMSAEPKLLM